MAAEDAGRKVQERDEKAKEYATCRRIIFRYGAGSAVDKIRRLFPEELKASEEARAVLDCLDKRKRNMRYG